jgi:hypothetical protein
MNEELKSNSSEKLALLRCPSCKAIFLKPDDLNLTIPCHCLSCDGVFFPDPKNIYYQENNDNHIQLKNETESVVTDTIEESISTQPEISTNLTKITITKEIAIDSKLNQHIENQNLNIDSTHSPVEKNNSNQQANITIPKIKFNIWNSFNPKTPIVVILVLTTIHLFTLYLLQDYGNLFSKKLSRVNLTVPFSGIYIDISNANRLRTSDGRELMYLSGTIKNRGSKVAQQIELQGITYSSNGEKLTDRRVLLKEQISMDEIKAMTRQEINQQELARKPLSLELGKSAPFSILVWGKDKPVYYSTRIVTVLADT